MAALLGSESETCFGMVVEVLIGWLIMVVVRNGGVCEARNGCGEELRVQGESRGEPWAPLAALNSSNGCVEAEGPHRMALAVVTGLCGVA